ncbi:MAG: hypothetical protein Q9162_001151 [Coniocarpon cinnabarinum]
MSRPELFDIVVIGAGPVGLVLSCFLQRWGYKIKHIDNRAEPTPTGRADGIQPRSIEMLKNMGLKADIFKHKPARVYEVAFWDPGNQGGIVRTGSWASCPDFIDARYSFTALLHQGLIERTFIADIEKNGGTIQRPWTILDFENNGADPEYPVEVQLGHVENNSKETIRTKYLFSGEGGKSFVRSKLNIPVHYKDPISHVWGVMDGVVRTNFPDIKMKCTIHSDAGSIMVIPRESNMVRLYIQLASSTDADFNPRKTASTEEVKEAAKRILKPYFIEWENVEWYSVYPIGQGISERYTLDQRVFMGGDVCHTHSPKAGQGMNTAFLDAQNLAWKLHGVEAGFLQRSTLETYESERRYIAEELLNFDAKYSKLFSTKQPGAAEVHSASSSTGGHSSTEENPFVKTFKENCEFTSGYGVAYQNNIFDWSSAHPAKSPLFLSYPEQTPLRTGRILPPVTVTRVTDANVVPLEQEIPANGSFRIFIFAGHLQAKNQINKSLEDFAYHSMRPQSYLSAHMRRDVASVNYHERHNPHSHFYTFCTVFAAHRSDIEVDDCVPTFLLRYRDHVYADDIWSQRVPNAKAAGHAKMLGNPWTEGAESGHAAVVVVRPDGYIGCVVRLVEGSGTVDALNAYFGAFTVGVGEGIAPRAQL